VYESIKLTTCLGSHTGSGLGNVVASLPISRHSIKTGLRLHRLRVRKNSNTT